MRRTADVVVIGSGIIGTSIALETARRGLKTVLVDRNADAGGGCTRNSAAVVRSFFGTKPAVALAFEGRKAYEGWAEHVKLDKPRARLEAVGCALLLPANDDGVGDALLRLLRSVGVPAENLSGRESHSLVPGMRTASTKVLFECGAGYVSSAQAAARDVRAAAEAAGAAILFNQRVVEIRSEDGSGRKGSGRRVSGVATEAGDRIDAPVVVNAAGVSSARVNLLARAPLPLNTVPLVQHHVEGEVDGAESFPVVADVAAGHWVRFDKKGFRLGLLGCGKAGLEVQGDPEGAAPAPPSVFLAERRRSFLKRHPGKRWRGAKVVSGCCDATVLDRHPIVDTTDLRGYYVAVGTSGRWFKGAPAIGWLMAELITAVESGHDHDAGPLRVTLPRTGLPFDLAVLKRSRPPLRCEIPWGLA